MNTASSPFTGQQDRPDFPSPGGSAGGGGGDEPSAASQLAMTGYSGGGSHYSPFSGGFPRHHPAYNPYTGGGGSGLHGTGHRGPGGGGGGALTRCLLARFHGIGAGLLVGAMVLTHGFGCGFGRMITVGGSGLALGATDAANAVM